MKATRTGLQMSAAAAVAEAITCAGVRDGTIAGEGLRSTVTVNSTTGATVAGRADARAQAAVAAVDARAERRRVRGPTVGSEEPPVPIRG